MAREGRSSKIGCMRRGWLKLLGTPVLALWFALVVGEPPWLIACPVHAGHGAAAAAESHHASHGATGHDDSAHHCLCVGDCCAAAGPSAPASRDQALPLIAAEGRGPAWRPVAYHPVAVAYALPFANGPPTTHHA